MAVEESGGDAQQSQSSDAIPFPLGIYPEKGSDVERDCDRDAETNRAATVMPMPPFDLPLTPPARRERPRVREAGRLVVIALTLGWAFDALCGGGGLGVGFPLFFLSLLGALFSLGLWEGTAVRWRNAGALALPLLFFAAMTAVRANGFLTFWNVTAT